MYVTKCSKVFGQLIEHAQINVLKAAIKSSIARELIKKLTAIVEPEYSLFCLKNPVTERCFEVAES